MIFFWMGWKIRNLGKKKGLRALRGDPLNVEALRSIEGKPASLAGAKRAVFYFYPKDDTPGCTIEAKEFTQREKEFSMRGVKVFGVSADGPESHKAFCDKFGITFPLLMDSGGRVGRELGNWRGINHARTTVLVDASGHILELWDNVKAQGHAQAVLDSLGA